MPDRILPDRPNLEQYKKQAKELLRVARAGEATARARVRKHHPRLTDFGSRPEHTLQLTDAQLVIAREHGYASWAEFAKHIESLHVIRSLEESKDPANTFIEAACVNHHGWHRGGTLEDAGMILSHRPGVAAENIYCAAVLADEVAVRNWLARDAKLATAKGGPHGWDALTYLCFSRYLRIDKTRSESFARCARALLEAGADANTGWTESIDDPPRTELESAIYGAAGVAQNAGVTQVLLEYGADPNDGETAYHVPETYDNTVLKILLDSGRFDERSLATVAARKCDWHDDVGLELALECGANPNLLNAWKYSPFHQSIRRDNGLVMIEQFLDHGADPLVANNLDGRNAFQMAAYHGRKDILDVLDRRGFEYEYQGLDKLVAACARAQTELAQAIGTREPALLAQLYVQGGTLLARFAGADNEMGIGTLLALGISPNALWNEGDGYWELAPGSTALHVAAWRANHQVVSALIAAGTEVNARDSQNRTALQLAVRACIDSYWKYRRKPDSVAALLGAGASIDGINLPTGYDAIDELLLACKKSMRP